MRRRSEPLPSTFKTKLKEHDRVRVLVPRFVTRVGYPCAVNDYLKLVDDKPIMEMFKANNLWPPPSNLFDRFRRDLAHQLAHKDGFGGPWRTLHFIELPEYQDAECVVYSIRTALTGTYRPTNSYGNYGEFGDVEPAGLDNVKHHRLATVNLVMPPGKSEDTGRWWRNRFTGGNYLEIPIGQLVRLEDEQAKADTITALLETA